MDTKNEGCLHPSIKYYRAMHTIGPPDQLTPKLGLKQHKYYLKKKKLQISGPMHLCKGQLE